MTRSNDLPIKAVLEAMVDEYKLRGKLHQTKIEKFWAEVMGTSINNYTRHIKLRGKKLYINIESASLKQELTFGREKLKKVLNQELGEDYIEDVIIR